MCTVHSRQQADAEGKAVAVGAPSVAVADEGSSVVEMVEE
jgi:hypothetical protein